MKTNCGHLVDYERIKVAADLVLGNGVESTIQYMEVITGPWRWEAVKQFGGYKTSFRFLRGHSAIPVNSMQKMSTSLLWRTFILKVALLLNCLWFVDKSIPGGPTTQYSPRDSGENEVGWWWWADAYFSSICVHACCLQAACQCPPPPPPPYCMCVLYCIIRGSPNRLYIEHTDKAPGQPRVHIGDYF